MQVQSKRMMAKARRRRVDKARAKAARVTSVSLSETRKETEIRTEQAGQFDADPKSIVHGFGDAFARVASRCQAAVTNPAVDWTHVEHENHPADRDSDAGRRTLHVDVEEYQAALDCPELSPEQRQRILKTLWLIIVTFVDLGFSVQPQEEFSSERSANHQPSARDA